MEDAFVWLIAVGVFVVRIVLPVVKWFQEQAAKSQGGKPAGAAAGQEQLRALREAIQSMAQGLEPAIGPEQVGAALRRNEALQRQAEVQLQRMPTSDGPLSVIREALEAPTLTDLRATHRRLTALKSVLDSADEAARAALLRNDTTMGESKRAADLAEARLSVLAEATVAREQRLSDVMADSDRFAAALSEPLRDFADAHGLPLPPNAPISVPTAPGSEAMIRGLFDQHPVIFVPEDFGESIFRWPAVAHEVGHVVWHAMPGLRRQMGRLVPTAERPWVARPANGQLIFDIDAAYAHWLEEVWCDAFAMIVLGPAGFRGLLHAFATPDNMQRDLVAVPQPNGQLLGEHPPRHLRVHLAAHLLHELGYDIEVKALLAGWQRMHEDADYLLLPVLGGQFVSVDLSGFVARGVTILDGLMSEEFGGLGGYPLSAVSGLELGPGLWARVGRRAEDLLKGVSFHDSPRVVIAAGIEAAAASPSSREKIAAGVRSAIVGFGQQAAADPHFRGHVHGEVPPPRAGTSRGRARDAILLWEILHRKHGLSSAPREGHI